MNARRRREEEEKTEEKKKSSRLDKKKRSKYEIIYHICPKQTVVLLDRIADDVKQMMCLN
jgi:hypothetical protein